jgi:hypothetical protein
MRHRLALSLVEVVIAMTLFAIVLFAVMQATTAVIQYGALGEAEDDLNRSGAFVMRAISDDLYTSGWNVPSGLALPTVWSAPATSPPTDPPTPPGDREVTYYPYAIAQGVSLGLGNLSGYHSQAPSVYSWFDQQDSLRQERLRAALPGLPADFTNFFSPARAAFLNSYFARSVSLVFVKSMVDDWSLSPTQKSRGLNNFRRIDFKSAEPRYPGDPRSTTDAQWATPGNQDALGVLYGSPWGFVLNSAGNPELARRAVSPAGVSSLTAVSDLTGDVAPYGVLIAAGRFDPTASSQLQPMWETITAPNYASAVQPPLREYVYCVVPSPLGVGRLVRAHLAVPAGGPAAADAVQTPNGITIGTVLSGNATAEMVVDSVLSDDVTRVVFETFRTQDPGTVSPLAINQVRMRLYLARVVESANSVVVKTVIDTVVTMRARNTAPQIAADITLVPSLTGGFHY